MSLPLVLCLEPRPGRFIQLEDALFMKAQLLWVDTEAKALTALESWGPSFVGVLLPSHRISSKLRDQLARFGLNATIHGEGDAVSVSVLEGILAQLSDGSVTPSRRG